MTFFPSHSFEQFYQSVRRCWRYGQRNPVRVSVITSPGECGVLKNLRRKSKAADGMFARLVQEMNSPFTVKSNGSGEKKARMPKWL
jgi:hypothetical protein